MFGSALGNLVGVSYFAAFQVLGIILALILFKKEKLGFTILLGSTIGSFSLQWLPVVYSFFLNFTVKSHILALFTMIAITFFVFYFSKEKSILNGRKINFNIKKWFVDDPILFLLLPLFIFVCITLCHHTISEVAGTLHSGQSTYGDMNMHLGFITSIAKQKIFPPEYSILPGTKLAYPFLSDSISSSVYIWGTSLRVAYLLPMFFALLQVFFGMYFIAKNIFKSFGKSYKAKSILSFALFFLNGGFGFIYFITDGFSSPNFTRIFTEFYQTPTNLVGNNIMWHNVICDMLIPQRATLFGWAILFPTLALILKARKSRDTKLFVIAGILAAGLVLIHTHSFLALGFICAVYLVQDLYKNVHLKDEQKRKRFPMPIRLVFVSLFLVAMTFISKKQYSKEVNNNPFSENTIMLFGFGILGFFGILLIYYLIKGYKKSILTTWGTLLGIVIVLALPQLLGFTFKQAQGEQFLRGGFNWANNTMDNYCMFYIKNLGIVFILLILMLITGTKKQIQTVLPAILLWTVCEFILFQPNPYDNNKLLLVGSMYFCIAISDYVLETVPEFFKKLFKAKKNGIKKAVAITLGSVTAFLGVFAAVLTMGREYVSDYDLYGKDYVKMCEWVEDNTEPTDVFLTATNHNNALASLTGRNIVCGSSSFLFFHGVNYQPSEMDVKMMYENPTQRDILLKKHKVSYILVGSTELATYQIPDINDFANKYNMVYNKDGVAIFEV